MSENNKENIFECDQELLGQFSSTVEQKLYDQDLRNNDKKLILNLYQKK
jgi:hypothetical protein